ncbi:MAG: hypothetical protein U1F77_10940 [Kiritimatiellia bacterium]
MIHPSALLASCLPAGNVSTASPLAGWRHEGTVWLLTTPEGAGPPAPAGVENFPGLLRVEMAADFFPAPLREKYPPCSRPGTNFPEEPVFQRRRFP